MQIHHQKHHAAYVTNLNIATTKLEEAQAKGDISSIISLQQAIKFNGGGHLNHSIFWNNLAPVSKVN
jgi:Fe-Mn family superoxide dismutase